jgi:hypothetical protein
MNNNEIASECKQNIHRQITLTFSGKRLLYPHASWVPQQVRITLMVAFMQPAVN